MLPVFQDRINRHERAKQKQNQNQGNYWFGSDALEDWLHNLQVGDLRLSGRNFLQYVK